MAKTKRELIAQVDEQLAIVNAAFAAHEKPHIDQLEQIAQAIGYGRSCQIIGDLWDRDLERTYGQGAGRRGSMERRPDIELVERLERERDQARAACGEWQAKCHELRAKLDGKA